MIAKPGLNSLNRTAWAWGLEAAPWPMLATRDRTGYYSYSRMEVRRERQANVVFVIALGLLTVQAALFAHHGAAVYDVLSNP
jgi:hypothetical protein